MKELDKNERTLFILPHLDDEFALAPLIKSFVAGKKENCFFLYCAEEIHNPNRQKRRSEANVVLNYFNVDSENVMFMNDHFITETRKIYEVFPSARSMIETLLKKWDVKQIITLAFEGGHPDHDALALIVYGLQRKLGVRAYYAPAYNRHAFGYFFRLRVCRPLPTQKHLYYKFRIGLFDWTSTLKVALLYRSQFRTFTKLLPLMLPIVLFQRYIFLSRAPEVSTVDWITSLSSTRYATDIKVIERIVDSLEDDR